MIVEMNKIEFAKLVNFVWFADNLILKPKLEE